jgi:hypothetical protein
MQNKYIIYNITCMCGRCGHIDVLLSIFTTCVCVHTRVVRAAHLGYTCGTHVLLILLITETEKTKHNKLILINPP